MFYQNKALREEKGGEEYIDRVDIGSVLII